ncbi:hypothetical protein LSCM1_01089 [Leishmania martiniquensis]|uniref:Guanine nucleotide-binding protein subunit beta-like protein n=1 Tax=Leishmania martiniquensis TaxID=1580590 RepID=A0A836KC60_9TRYP|nr:hypothetical protein LSCM1_01089 [Leishmania martiniquensis]
MSSVASAFDDFRCAYLGADDSVNDLDVDPHGGQLYAACSNGDVCVWDIRTQRLHARLRHPQWVNAVRCFPLCNSAASCATSSQQQPAVSPEAVDGADLDPLRADAVVHQNIRWVITASEDGVIATWCPVTYRMQSICRPGGAAITALQLIPQGSSSTVGKDNAPEMEHSTNGATRRRLFSKASDGPAVCCAASLRDVYVLLVTISSSELLLLHALQHHCLITAITYVPPSVSLSTPLLVVGQEEGTLCVWDCATWCYHDTMPYPAGEADVAADARDDPTSVREPVYQLGRLFHTFLYNRRRCNSLTDHAALEEEALTPPSVDPSVYLREMPAMVSADAVGMVESSCGALPHRAKQAFLEQEQGDGSVGLPAAPRSWRYDARRVTCLAASRYPAVSSPNSYLYSGHATGEVLLWGSVRKELPLLLLLKKIFLFSPGVWVWHLCAVPTLHTSTTPPSGQSCGAEATDKPLSRRAASVATGGARAKAAISRTASRRSLAGMGSHFDTTHVSPLELIVWSDGGAVEYVSARKRLVLHRRGPGFVCQAACVWSGPPMAPQTASRAANALEGDQAASARPPTAALSRHDDGAIAGSEHAGSFSARLYLTMAGFDGRVERYDVTEVLALVKSSGKVF